MDAPAVEAAPHPQPPPAPALPAPAPAPAASLPFDILGALLTLGAAVPPRPPAPAPPPPAGRGRGPSVAGRTAAAAAAARLPPSYGFTHPARGHGPPYVSNRAYARPLTSQTDLRFLHLPIDMATAMLPDIQAYTDGSARSRVGRPLSPGGRIRTGGRHPVFAARVRLLLTDGTRWPVLFRTYLTGKQYHRRLTDGWRAFCAAQNLAMGDAVHFWRDPRDDFDGNHPADEPPALVLRIRVVRRAMAVAPG